jgi:hypothetical protein
MTRERKPAGPPAEPVVINESSRLLSDHELDHVSGGGVLQSAVSEVLKNFGSALNTAARGG